MQVARPSLFFYFGLLVYKVTSPFCDFAEHTHVFLFFVVFAVMMFFFFQIPFLFPRKMYSVFDV